MDKHETLYQKLRSELLSRHWAVGRHNRTNYFTNQTVLGDYEKEIKCCNDEGVYPKHLKDKSWLYNNTMASFCLRNTEIERWRIRFRLRTNGLGMSSIGCIQLLIEYTLGKRNTIHSNAPVKKGFVNEFINRIINDLKGIFGSEDRHKPPARQPENTTPEDNLLGKDDSLIAVLHTLKTIRSLFKFPNKVNDDANWAGYISRWSPGTTDNWRATIDNEQNENATDCCEFLTNPDEDTFDNQHFLYSTPLDNSIYLGTIEPGNNFNDQYRRWEVSHDELVGLIGMYNLAWFVLHDDNTETVLSIKKEISEQCLRLAKYLQYCGYMLVRPACNYTARGAAQGNETLEYPFKKVFERILGTQVFHENEFDKPSATFEESFVRAGVWYEFQKNLPMADIIDYSHTDFWWSYVRPVDMQNYMRDHQNDTRVIMGILGQFFNNPQETFNSILDNRLRAAVMFEQFLFGATYLYNNLECIKVLNDEERRGFLLTFFTKTLTKLDQGAVVSNFSTFMMKPVMEDNWSDYMKPWIGLMALGEESNSLRPMTNLYLTWYNAYIYQKALEAAIIPINEVNNEENPENAPAPYWCITSYPTAIALLLEKPGSDRYNELLHILNMNFETMHNSLSTEYDSNLIVRFSDASAYEEHDKKGNYFGYMLPLSLYWLSGKLTNRQNAIPNPTRVSMSDWLPPIIKKDILRNAIRSDDPDSMRLIIPINSIKVDHQPSLDNIIDISVLDNPQDIPDDNSLGIIDRPISRKLHFEEVYNPTIPDLAERFLHNPSSLPALLTKRMTPQKFTKPQIPDDQKDCYTYVESWTPNLNYNGTGAEIKEVNGEIQVTLILTARIVPILLAVDGTPLKLPQFNIIPAVYKGDFVASWVKKICGGCK